MGTASGGSEFLQHDGKFGLFAGAGFEKDILDPGAGGLISDGKSTCSF